MVLCCFFSDDNLAMIGVTFVKLPDQFWPVLDMVTLFKVTVKNMGKTEVSNAGNGIFKVRYE